jgi:hypothetical protein
VLDEDIVESRKIPSVLSLIFFVALWPNVGYSLLIHGVSGSHTTTHHSRYDSSGRLISPTDEPLPDNTQISQQTSIHCPGRIRAHNLSRRAAADLCLRPRGHWDWQSKIIGLNKSPFYVTIFFSTGPTTQCGFVFCSPLVGL